MSSADGLIYKFDGSEALAAHFVGFNKVAAALGDTPLVYLPGQIVPGFAGLTPGAEYFIKNDATLALWAGIVPGQWTRSVGVALSASELLCIAGPVIPRP
jgi:hypothetical protein